MEKEKKIRRLSFEEESVLISIKKEGGVEEKKAGKQRKEVERKGVVWEKDKGFRGKQEKERGAEKGP